MVPTIGHLKRDQEEYNDYWINSKTVDRVKYHCDFNFEMQEDHIIICDEADYLMFKYTEEFFSKAT